MRQALALASGHVKPESFAPFYGLISMGEPILLKPSPGAIRGALDWNGAT